MTSKYEQFFGFSSPLFSDAIPQDENVFRTPDAEKLFQELSIALYRKDSAAIIGGPAGVGKTTLATEALKSIDTRLAFAAIASPPRNGEELLEQLLNDFGLEPASRSHVERLQLWRQFLSEMAATDSRVCLMIENAENFGEDVLRELHHLTASDAAMTPGANLVLTTGQEASRLLTADSLSAFAQRVRLRWQIAPLSAEEVSDYLIFKCRAAGADASTVFTGDFAGRLHALSGGILKIIDNLIESALLAAAAAGENPVSAERLAETALRQFGATGLEPKSVDALLETPDAAIPTLTEVVAPELISLIEDTEQAGESPRGAKARASH